MLKKVYISNGQAEMYFFVYFLIITMNVINKATATIVNITSSKNNMYINNK